MNELVSFRNILCYFLALLGIVALTAPIAELFGPWKIVTIYIPLLIIGMFLFVFVGVLRASKPAQNDTVSTFKLREAARHGPAVTQTGTEE